MKNFKKEFEYLEKVRVILANLCSDHCENEDIKEEMELLAQAKHLIVEATVRLMIYNGRKIEARIKERMNKEAANNKPADIVRGRDNLSRTELMGGK